MQAQHTAQESARECIMPARAHLPDLWHGRRTYDGMICHVLQGVSQQKCQVVRRDGPPGDELGLIDQMNAQYRVDTRRIYVTGYSMGGFGTCEQRTLLVASDGDQAGNMAPDPEIPVCPDAANEKPPGLRGDHGRDEPPDSLQSEEGIPRWAFELGCWTMVALAPFLTWVNGPPVSTDQAVVRTAVFSLAFVGGIVLTGLRLFRKRSG